MGIAVLSENATLFAHAAAFWAQRAPSYLYNFAADGAVQPAFPPGRGGVTTWYNQSVFNASTSGVCQETCRDMGHTGLGVGSLTNAAETAWVQGTDLYDTQVRGSARALR